MNHDEQATASESVIEEITEGYLNYDEDTIHNHVKPFSSLCVNIDECIQAGLTTLDGMDNDLESYMKVIYHFYHLRLLMGQLL